MSEQISEYAVVARMNELGIKKSQLQCFKYASGFQRMISGKMVTVETANSICAQLNSEYSDLFASVQNSKLRMYALPKLVGSGVVDDSDDLDINKSTVKPKRPIPPAQSTCPLCGRLAIRFRERDGILMCARCADIPRCADCHNPAHLLYVVDGRMICPRCESRMKQKETDTK